MREPVTVACAQRIFDRDATIEKLAAGAAEIAAKGRPDMLSLGVARPTARKG